MNLSGDALKPYVRKPFWAAKTDLLVIVDDVALPVGRYRLRSRGSAGGHNGLRNTSSMYLAPRSTLGCALGWDRTTSTGRLREISRSSFSRQSARASERR